MEVSMLIKFEKLDVGERFYDQNTTEFFVKVCDNAAEFLIGGNYHTGQLATFEYDDFVEVDK
jgi:hypothetical protein